MNKSTTLSVTFINPPFLKNYSRQSRSPCVAKSGTIYYSYYLAYAGVAAELAGACVSYIDAIAHELSSADCMSRLQGISPELVVIDTSTPSIISDIKFAAEIKKYLPNATVLCVGTFPSKNTKEFFRIVNTQDYLIDGCLVGEYEETIYELLVGPQIIAERLQHDGLIWTNGFSPNSVTPVLRLTSEEFLDRLGFVSEFYKRHLGERGIKKHFYASITWPYLQILTSRGCPYKCSFCNIPSIGSYRTRSIQSVVDEFLYIERELPYVSEVFIEDDTFPINKKRTIELCSALIDAGLNLKWSCNARVNTDEETLSWMRRANCRLTCVGFESPNLNALNGVIKKSTSSQQDRYMELANKTGLKVNGCFILGLPHDTPESIQETITYAKKLLPNTAQFYPHMVYPGTGSFNWAEQNNLLEHKDWSRWLTAEGFHNTPLKLNGMTSKDLLEWADRGRLQFYTNPHFLLRMAFQALSSLEEFKRMFIAGRSFFPLLLRYILNRNT